MLNTLQNKLQKRINEHNFRCLSLNTSLVDFCSNDYLGLAQSTILRNKIGVAFNELEGSIKNGSTGSRLISGNTKIAEELECILSVIFKSESALLFASGYMANLGIWSSIPARGDTILYDELCHASIKDGIRLSFADRFSFKHNDVEDLERKLKKAKGTIFIGIESIYSMDGDQAPLKDLVKLSKIYNAYLIVDEAHSTGIFGIDGNGLCCQLGIENEIFIRVQTFGKAIGTEGAVVVSHESVKEYLINFCRTFIYTTAPSIHSLISVKCAFEFLKENKDLFTLLIRKINLFSGSLNGVGLIKSTSPIQSLLVSGNERVLKMSRLLENHGIWVKPILSPTVKTGSERIRFCIHTFNDDEEIYKLIKAIKTGFEFI